MYCSIHLYAGLGPRDRTEVEKEYGRYVYGPDAGDFGINVCRGLIMKAVGMKISKEPVQPLTTWGSDSSNKQIIRLRLLTTSTVYGTRP